MKLFLTALVAALLLVSGHASACQTFEHLLKRSPPGLVVGYSQPVNGSRAQALIAKFNAMPPATDTAGDEVRFAFFATGQTAFTILNKGCIVNGSIFDQAQIKTLLDALPPKGADT